MRKPRRNTEVPKDRDDVLVTEATDPIFGFPIGTKTIRTHGPEQCKGYACPVHNATDHHMRQWPTLWRSDTQVLERLCPHGVGHPDPDQYPYWHRIGAMGRSTHGCDGCCIPPRKGDELK